MCTYYAHLMEAVVTALLPLLLCGGSGRQGSCSGSKVGVEVVATRNKMWLKMWIKTYSTVSTEVFI